MGGFLIPRARYATTLSYGCTGTLVVRCPLFTPRRGWCTLILRCSWFADKDVHRCGMLLVYGQWPRLRCGGSGWVGPESSSFLAVLWLCARSVKFAGLRYRWCTHASKKRRGCSFVVSFWWHDSRFQQVERYAHNALNLLFFSSWAAQDQTRGREPWEACPCTALIRLK